MAVQEIHRWEKVQQRALATGALEPLVTRIDTLQDDGFQFSVRVMQGGPSKPAPSTDGTSDREADHVRNVESGPIGSRNPFQPYEEDLFVCDVEPQYVCLLNKYQVVAPHLLLVTREFQRQEEALNERDFRALAAGLGELEGLGFYNAGREAGASQPHKHLQLIPFLNPHMPGFPLLGVWEQATPSATEGIWQAPLPFPHALTPSNWPKSGTEIDSESQGRRWTSHYRQMLGFLHLHPSGSPDPAPYNLLVTRQWMFMVPRGREVVEGISLNALAFAGGLLVRDEGQWERVSRRGPISMLQEATRPHAVG